MCIIRSSVGSKAATILPADIKDYIISSNKGKNISIRIVRPVDSAIKFSSDSNVLPWRLSGSWWDRHFL